MSGATFNIVWDDRGVIRSEGLHLDGAVMHTTNDNWSIA